MQFGSLNATCIAHNVPPNYRGEGKGITKSSHVPVAEKSKSSVGAQEKQRRNRSSLKLACSWQKEITFYRRTARSRPCR